MSDTDSSFDSGSVPEYDPDASLSDYIPVQGEHLISFDNSVGNSIIYFKDGFIKLEDELYTIFNYKMEELVQHADPNDFSYPATADNNDEYLIVLLSNNVYIYLTENYTQLMIINLDEFVGEGPHEQQLLVCQNFFYIKHIIHVEALVFKFRFDGKLVDVYHTPTYDCYMTKYQDQCLLYSMCRRGHSHQKPVCWSEYKFVENDDGRRIDSASDMVEYTGNKDYYPYKCYQQHDDEEDDCVTTDQILVKPISDSCLKNKQLYPAIRISAFGEIVYATDEEIYITEQNLDTVTVRKFNISAS